MSEGEAKAKAKGIMKHNGHAMKKVVHMVIEQVMTPEFGYIGKGDKCYVFFSPCSSTTLVAPSSLLCHPRHSSLDSQGLLYTLLSLSHPYTLLSTPTPSLLVPFPLLPPTPLNTELLRSMDLPWISPGSPHLPTDTHLRVFPCFPSLASLVSPSSLHPYFPVTLHHLILLLSLIPCTTIDFFSH